MRLQNSPFVFLRACPQSWKEENMVLMLSITMAIHQRILPFEKPRQQIKHHRIVK
jgi:hypothetical protein